MPCEPCFHVGLLRCPLASRRYLLYCRLRDARLFVAPRLRTVRGCENHLACSAEPFLCRSLAPVGLGSAAFDGRRGGKNESPTQQLEPFGGDGIPLHGNVACPVGLVPATALA